MDKIDRLFDAMEHPELHSPAELEEMLRDPEVMETFDMLDKMKSSLQTIDIPDIDEEWKTFENDHLQATKTQRYWLTRFFSRNAAACIAIGIISVTAVAAIVGVGINSNHKHSTTTPEVEISIGDAVPVSQQDTIKTIDDVRDTTPEIIVFDDETFETIMDRVSTYYGYDIIFNNNTAKSLRLYFRWNQALPIEDIVESLNNFEQISLKLKDKAITID